MLLIHRNHLLLDRMLINQSILVQTIELLTTLALRIPES
jgi:hypothetical protein